MRKLVLFMHTSLDGFVGGPNGEMNWIQINEEMFDFVALRTNESDKALYGRITYQMMEAYWPTAAQQPNATKHDREHGAWYNQVHKVVMSRTMQGKQLPNTTIISKNVQVEIEKLKTENGKDILIFGSPSAAHALMQKNLIDEYWLFVNPVLLGKGIPLFKNIQEMVKLKLQATKVFPCGVVCLHYGRE